MKRFAVVCLSIVGCLSAFATNTWYVAKNDPNAADTIETGRGSEALPFRTIQAALDNAAFEAGDIVLVKPGEYDEGTYVASGNYQMTNRVYISKTVYLKSTEGRDRTTIVGKWGTTGQASTGRGTNGIRCVFVGENAKETVIEGFTLLNGAAYGSVTGDTRNYNLGGGISVSGKTRDVYAVDCKFKNCTGYFGGGIYGGTAIRCIFDKCRNYKLASVLCGTYAFACAATRCTQSSDTKRYALDEGSVAVNCTFVGNTCRGMTNDTGVAYNCLFGANGTPTVHEGSSTNDCVVTTDEKVVHVFATGYDDYRLLSDSAAVGAANPAHRQVLIDLGVPAKYLEKDLRGDVIDWSAATMNVGAVQATVETVAGTIAFAANTYVDDRLVEAGQWICSETWPVSYEIRPASTSKPLMYWSRTSEGSSVYDVRPSVVYPTLDGKARLWPPHRAIANATYQQYTPQFAATNIWVDASNGSDTTGTGAESAPFKTLQYAVDRAAAGTRQNFLIHAKPGDYDEGGKTFAGIKSRVDLSVFGYSTPGAKKQDWNVMIRAEEGPSVTTIWGAADTTGGDASGCGPNAVRCVFGETANGKIQGFTLRDGHTFAATDDGANPTNTTGAAAYVFYSKTNTMRQQFPLVDCIITNCVSADALCHWTQTHRCRFSGNTAAGAIYTAGYHTADLIAGNTCAAVIGDSEKSRNFFLTCVDNVSPDGTTPVADWQDDGIPVFGSIFVGGSVTVASTQDKDNVVWEHASVAKLSAKSSVADPLFLDRVNGDFRPANVPPVADTVNALDYKQVTEYLSVDINGKPYRLSAGGKLTAGCLQANLPTAVIVRGADASLLVNGVAGGASTNLFETGALSLTVAANEQTSRYAKGFTVNGVEHLFSTYPGSETTELAAGQSGYTLDLSPVLSTDWYVDAENGNDASNGFAPSVAKRTLADVMTNTVVTAGDTVNLLPGTYDEGALKAYDGDVVWNRVVVPAGVTLKATGSAEETLIVGAAAPEPTDTKGYGLGTNAVRCVFLQSRAVLDGVTVTGGRSDAVSSGVKTMALDCGFGGGITGSGGLVRNCLITNNFAYNGGGGALVSYVKCIVRDNRSVYRSGALYRPNQVEDSVIVGNVSGGGYTVMYPSSVYNCTFGDNGGSASVYKYQPNDGEFSIFNSILDRIDNKVAIYWHCVINTNNAALSEAKLNYEGAGSIGVAGREALMLDADFRPLAGSPVIDIGDAAKSSAYRDDVDLAGNPRILNGGLIDAGAFEYDWRVDYGRILGRGVTVTEVTSNVVVGVDGKSVVVPEGSLAATWQSKGKPLSFKTTVTGEGTLTVTVNGTPYATVTAAMGEKTFRLPESLAETSLAFAYEGEGSAALSSFKRESGVILVVR